MRKPEFSEAMYIDVDGFFASMGDYIRMQTGATRHTDEGDRSNFIDELVVKAWAIKDFLSLTRR